MLLLFCTELIFSVGCTVHQAIVFYEYYGLRNTYFIPECNRIEAEWQLLKLIYALLMSF